MGLSVYFAIPTGAIILLVLIIAPFGLIRLWPLRAKDKEDARKRADEMNGFFDRESVGLSSLTERLKNE